MQQQHMMDRQRGSGRGRLLARVQRQGGVGMLVGLLLLPVGVLAQGAGDLDTSFSSDGQVTTAFEGDAPASDVALQPDGKIVVAGYADFNGTAGFALVRYHPNGPLDPTFGGDGLVITDVGGNAISSASALVMQPRDGRLVVVGQSSGDFALARYHAITCGDVVVTRVGTNRNDVIIGTNGPDVINAFGGNDTLIGLGGNDLLCGDLGKDILLGGAGDDILRGGSGTDVCSGGAQISGDTAVECEIVTNVP